MAKLFKGTREKITVKCTAECIVDGNRINKVSFHCIYKTLGTSEAKQVLQDAAAGDLTDHEILARYMIDWEGIVDDDDQAIQFDDETFAQAMEEPAYRTAMAKGFMQSLLGKEALRQKN